MQLPLELLRVTTLLLACLWKFLGWWASLQKTSMCQPTLPSGQPTSKWTTNQPEPVSQWSTNQPDKIDGWSLSGSLVWWLGWLVTWWVTWLVTWLVTWSVGSGAVCFMCICFYCLHPKFRIFGISDQFFLIFSLLTNQHHQCPSAPPTNAYRPHRW